MKNVSQILKNSGLSDSEARVYAALLEMGEANIAQITKKSGVNRSSVYLVLDSLREKGVARAVKKQKTLFYAEDPRKILDDLSAKKTLLENSMPEILASFALLDKKPEIRYFEGEKGIKEIYKDFLLHENNEILAFNSDDYRNFFDEDFLLSYFIPERKKKKIWTRAIYPETELLKNLATNDIEHFRKSKFISNEKFHLEMGLYLYGSNKVAIISYRDGFGAIIISKALFNSWKSIFEVLWESAK